MWHRPLLHISYLPIQVLKTSLGGGAYRGANGNSQSIRKIQQDQTGSVTAASENNSDSFESGLRNLNFNE